MIRSVAYYLTAEFFSVYKFSQYIKYYHFEIKLIIISLLIWKKIIRPDIISQNSSGMIIRE